MKGFRLACLCLACLLLVPKTSAALGEKTSWSDHIDEAFYAELQEHYDDSYWTPDTALPIQTEEELAALAAFTADVTRDFAGKFVSLERDLDLGAHQWEPISYPEYEVVDGASFYRGGGFRGTFFGNGHSIDNLTMDRPADSILGLFGAVHWGTVQDLAVSGTIAGNWNLGGVAGYNVEGYIVGCDSSVDLTSTGSCVGGVAGQSTGVIRNCTSGGTNSASTADGGNIGGVVGWCGGQGTLRNCIHTGRVTGGYRVGGIAGRMESAANAVGCENHGDVQGVVSTGGIVGDASDGGVKAHRCYNAGEIICLEPGSYYAAGGISGRNLGSITDCRNDGRIHAGGAGTRAGGIAGFHGGTLTRCYNTGDISSDGQAETCGGIVGYQYLEDGMAVVSECENQGSVSGAVYGGGITGFLTSFARIDDCINGGGVTGSDYAGGVTGHCNGAIRNCYQSGPVSGALESSGIVGRYWTGDIVGCYYYPTPTDTNTLGQPLDPEIPLDQEQMDHLDFNQAWTLGVTGDRGRAVLLQRLQRSGLYDAVEAEEIVELAVPRVEYDLVGSRYTGSSRGETGLGDLTADALKWYAQEFLAPNTVAAIINGGAIRQDLYAGGIDLATLKGLYPYGDTVEVLTLTGAQVASALGAAANLVPRETPAFAQVSGIEYTILAGGTAAHAGNRVTISTIGGRVFDPDGVYQIATTNYLAEGRDGYEAFAQASGRAESGIAVEEAVYQFVLEQGPVLTTDYAAAEGRIQILPLKDVLWVPEEMLQSEKGGCLLATYDSMGKMLSAQKVSEPFIDRDDLPVDTVEYRFFYLDKLLHPLEQAVKGSLTDS